MISNLGQSAGKWVIRVLLVMLILSFALWGIADYLTAPTNVPVAEVAGTEIDSRTFSDEASRRMRLLQQQQPGLNLLPRQALALGIYDQVLSALIDRAALDARARDLGLAVPDDAVRIAARANDNFRNELGDFDPVRFQQALRQLGYGSEQQFVEALRGDMIRRQIEASVSTGLNRGPSPFAQAVLRYQNETRDVDFIVIPNQKLATVAEPTEEDLVTYHQAHPEAFSTAEMRRALLIDVSPEKIAESETVTDEEIAQVYEERLAEFTVPETRTAEQAIFADEEKAKAVMARVGEGLTFAAALEAESAPAPTPLGEVTDGEVVGPVGDAIFGGKADEIVGPVQTPFGWHLIHIQSVTEPSVQPLDEVKARIATDLKLEYATDRVIEYGNAIEDELAGGNRLADIARDLDLPLTEIGPIDSAGRDASGETAADALPGGALQAIFQQAPDRDLELSETATGGYFVVETVEILEPQLKPLTEVRETVAEDWRAEKLAEGAREARGKLAERINAGSATLADLAAEFGTEVQNAVAVSRQGGAPELVGALRDGVFEAEKDAASVGPDRDGLAQIVAVVRQITSPDLAGNEEQMQNLEDAIGQSFANDIVTLYRDSLRGLYNVQTNRRAMIRAIDPSLLQDPG